MSKFMQEFKAFAMKGNVVDMAVGVIIGGAFGKIVTSLVNDIIMPLVGSLLGNVDFTTLNATLRQAVMDGETVVRPAVVLNYGNFIQTLVDFLIIALSIFCMIKAVNRASELTRKKAEEAPAEPAPEPVPAPKPDDVVLLEEIRDLLKKDK